MNDELATALTRAAVRTEAFVTFVVPEARIAKQAREFGGGLEGRTRVLYALADEVAAMLRGGMGMTHLAPAGARGPHRVRARRPRRNHRCARCPPD